MSSGDVATLKVKQDRLMDDIHHTCQWGKGEAWGEYVSWISSFNVTVERGGRSRCILCINKKPDPSRQKQKAILIT